jgi:hypothetical protein
MNISAVIVLVTGGLHSDALHVQRDPRTHAEDPLWAQVEVFMQALEVGAKPTDAEPRETEQLLLTGLCNFCYA